MFFVVQVVVLALTLQATLRDRKSCYLFFYSKNNKFVKSGILLPLKLLKAMKLFTEQ